MLTLQEIEAAKRAQWFSPNTYGRDTKLGRVL